ncbi:MAG TPA: hypothetical protein VFC69_00905 [Dysgonamonadaceae bacterium]|nr:hypothetical protein [Dysgonamonadaceae bacterium]
MKMRKFLFLLLFSFLSLSIFAQKNEVKVMYSPVSLLQMDNWGRDVDGLSATYTGAFMAEYNRYVKPRLKIGVNIAYDHKNVSGTKTGSYRNPHPPYDWITSTIKQTNKEGWFFFSPQVGYEYIQKENFRMGSLVGVSMVLITTKDTVDPITGNNSYNIIDDKEIKMNFFFHAEVVNFTWGKNYGLTGQMGFGHKGLVSVGGFVRW